MRAALAVFGWLVPGGAYLLKRRYLQFALALGLVCGAFATGMALRGANLWPQPEELQGLDSLSWMMAHAGAAAKMLAGGPYLLARLFDYSRSFLDGHTHEYGSTLLVLAGLFNLLAVIDGVTAEKGERA
jgi:hypothetical protein